VPVADLHPFAGLQILVVFEEMLDLLERYLGQVGIFVDILIAAGEMR
jgi:hypothetical protein